MLTGQVKRLIWIQTDIIESESSPLSNHRQGRIQKIQKEGAEFPQDPPNRNFTFQDMQLTALWAYSWCKVK